MTPNPDREEPLTDDQLRPECEDLDLSHGPTRLLAAALYWRRRAIERKDAPEAQPSSTEGGAQPMREFGDVRYRGIVDVVREHDKTPLGLLKRWLTYGAEPAGMTPEIVAEKERFGEFFDDLNKRRDALIADTRAALLAAHPLPVAVEPAGKRGD